MRICVVSRRNATSDPAIRALVWSLDSVGHHVTVVCTGIPQPGLPNRVDVHSVAATGIQRVRRSALRRLGTLSRTKNDSLDDALLEAVAAANPDLVYPHRAEDLDLVDRIDAPALRRPEWPPPVRDMIALAPHSLDLSGSPVGKASSLLLTLNDQPPSPRLRHDPPVSVAIAYRVTPTNPGRYVESALRRSGASVTVLDGVLDWNQVPSEAAFLVVVESPYPALEVKGLNPGVPVLFWIHHGEHHLPANLRLASRYGAHAVLLAHSWHLAHRFPTPVHRFPFAVAPELVDRVRPWSERTYDVAMVGAGLTGSGGRYNRRREIIKGLEADPSLRTRFEYGLPPEQMVALYGDARIVINDGGRRHLPITMRVFEALGAGAVLLTEDLPGTDVVLRPDKHYVPMGDDVLHQVHSILMARDSVTVATAGHDWALSRHTYDHRVAQLFEIVGQMHPITSSPDRSFSPASPLAALIDRDVEAQHLAVFGEVADTGLRDRAWRPGHVDRLREASIDAVVIGDGPVADMEKAVLAARGYVYSDRGNAADVAHILERRRPNASISMEDDLLRADLGGTGYRMRPADHPLAL